MMKKPSTPFPTTGYYGPEYFCDRKDEVSRLEENIRGGHSTTLIALRRLGKTALIHHLFHKLGRGHITIYLDILATENLEGLLNRLSSAIASEYSERSVLGKKFWPTIKSLRPVISFDSLSGAPLISIKASPEESRQTIGEVLSILEDQKRPVVIAIDEFQQILEYPEKNTDAWLRSVVQELKNVTFIFSGSQQRLMQDLFSNPSRPFFRSTQFLKIGKLDEEIYRRFIIKKFKAGSKSISEEVVTEMLQWTDLYTYYVQLLCNRVFLSSGKNVTSENWKKEADRILKEQEFVFYNYREMLTKPQWELLKSIAREGKVYQPTSYAFTTAYELGNPATVLRSLNALLRMELIYKEKDDQNKSFYGIYDLLFRRWVEE